MAESIVVYLAAEATSNTCHYFVDIEEARQWCKNQIDNADPSSRTVLGFSILPVRVASAADLVVELNDAVAYIA